MFGRKKKTVEDEYGYEPQSEVSVEIVERFEPFLKEDEQVHFCQIVPRLGSGSKGNLDEIVYMPQKFKGAKGLAYIVLTNERIIAHFPRFSKDDVVSIDLDNIESIQVQNNKLTQRRVIIHTDGPSYDIQIGKADGGMVEHLQKLVEANQPLNNDREKTVSAADKLRELTELHEDGLISDKEFEDARAKCIDQL